MQTTSKFLVTAKIAKLHSKTSKFLFLTASKRWKLDFYSVFPLSGVTAYLTHKILVKTHKKERQCVK